MRKKEIFGEVKRRMTFTTLLVVMLVLTAFAVFLCVSFTNIINRDYLDKREKFATQTLNDIELKLIRTEGIVDEAINQYNILKANPREENFYNLNYLIGVIRNSLFMGGSYIPEVIVYDGAQIQAAAVNDTVHLAEIAAFLDGKAETVLQNTQDGEFYYTCNEKNIFSIRGGVKGAENGFLAIIIPAEFLLPASPEKKNYFLENINVYAIFDGQDVIKIDSETCLLPEKDTLVLTTDGREGELPGNILSISKHLEAYHCTLISYQKLTHNTAVDCALLIILLLVLACTMILCKVCLGKLIYNIIHPMEELYHQMNEYAGDEGSKHD